VIEENSLEIRNHGRCTQHWTHEDQEGESVIDLKLGNQPIVQWTILADEDTTGFDHEVIDWQVGVHWPEEVEN